MTSAPAPRSPAAGAAATGTPNADSTAELRPRLRGVSHQYAFFAALGAAVLLIALAGGARAITAAAIYGLTLCGLFAISALYHRIDWRPEIGRWMRRLDHSMIFVFIAGTYTPMALLALTMPLSTIVLVAVWAGALAGVTITLLWIDTPRWLTAMPYIVLGWVGLASLPQLLDHVGAAALALVLAGGALYTAGAVVYALRRPDPWPTVFGFHEIFHALVIAAATVQYLAIVLYVLPYRVTG
jgi:hemolysin III